MNKPRPLVIQTGDVKYHHIRNTGRGKKDNYTLAMLESDGVIYIGISKCSRKDQFNKEKGRVISTGRCLRLAEESNGRLDEVRENRWALALDIEEFALQPGRWKREATAIAESHIRSYLGRDSIRHDHYS